METILRIKKARHEELLALVELVSRCRNVDIEVFKPRFSLTYEIRIKGPTEGVEKARFDLAEFASRVGWKVE